MTVFLQVLEEYQIKLDRYALLATIAEKQFLDGWRPLVLPVVLNTHGDFCPGAIELQEWLVEKYRLRLILEPAKMVKNRKASRHAFGASCAHNC